LGLAFLRFLQLLVQVLLVFLPLAVLIQFSLPLFFRDEIVLSLVEDFLHAGVRLVGAFEELVDACGGRPIDEDIDDVATFVVSVFVKVLHIFLFEFIS
jgi:hypothetical protein